MDATKGKKMVVETRQPNKAIIIHLRPCTMDGLLWRCLEGEGEDYVSKNIYGSSTYNGKFILRALKLSVEVVASGS